jgi:hypothetical protein
MRHTLSVPLVLLLLTAGLILSGCGPLSASTPPPAFPTLLPSTAAGSGAITSAAQIVGIWQIYSPHCSPGYMLLRPDGTYTWSCQPDGSNGLSGKYHFSHGNFLVLNDLCGAEGRYEVHIAGDNPRALAFSVVSDTCDTEVQALTGQRVTWVSPLP